MAPKCNTCVYKGARDMCKIMFAQHFGAEKVFNEFCRGKWYFPKDEWVIMKKVYKDNGVGYVKKDSKYESLDVIDP